MAVRAEDRDGAIVAHGIAAADAANEALGRERVRVAAAAERRELNASRKLESKERDKVRNAARRERGRSGDGFD